MSSPYPEPLTRLIEQLQKWPGIGAKTAHRLAFHVLKAPREDAERLADALRDVKAQVQYCSICSNITDVDPCVYCTSPDRDPRVVCVVEDDAALAERVDMAFSGMLVERQQHIRLVSGAHDFSRADADLENGRPARDGGGNRHERHDFLFAASGQPGEEAPDGLDAVLGIARDADNGFWDFRDLDGSARRRVGNCSFTHDKRELR